MAIDELIDKYITAPRYTTYPTLSYWDAQQFDSTKWESAIINAFDGNNVQDGISLYIHLPYCDGSCTYGCTSRATKNHKVELPYIETVLKEWRLYLNLIDHKPIIKRIHLGGGMPTFFSAASLKQLIEGVVKDVVVHKQAEFSFEAHSSSTTAEHLIILNALGFRQLNLGIRDFDPGVQQTINCTQQIKEVEKITRLARENGYHSISYDLTYGLPNQTFSSLANTIGEVLRLNPDRIAFYNYTQVSGIKAGRRQPFKNQLPSVEDKKNLYEIGRKLFKEGGYAEVGMDHFVLKVDDPNFMDYSHQHSLVTIGLGVSSISDTGDAFAQNTKVIEDYIRIVNSGKLPVVNGHMLSEEDMVIRKHILNIICSGYTSWELPEQKSKAFTEGLNRMRWLAMDGLVLLSSNELRVTPFGKKFLRNICIALDARLWENRPKTQLLSLTD